MTDSGILHLYIAYSIVWIGWFIYLVYLHVKQARLEREIENLEGLVKAGGKKRIEK